MTRAVVVLACAVTALVAGAGLFLLVGAALSTAWFRRAP